MADRGYSSVDALKALQASGVTEYIPNRGQFKYQRDNLTYNPDEGLMNVYKGPRYLMSALTLPWATWMKQYGTNNKGCQGCPVSDSCDAHKPKSKRIIIKETIDKPYYELMHERMQTPKAQRMMKLRQSTVDPVIGSLVNYTGIGRV